MKEFKDLFSKQSATYAKYRPGYPIALFEYLSSLVPEKNMAWDVATGNGQSAISLSRYFKQVIATDASEQQIAHATPAENIIYKTEPAEYSSLADESINLITVAQALHWFNFEKFYKEVNRVIKNNGIIAAWAYTIPSHNEEVNQLINHFHDEVVGSYWQAENKLIIDEYKAIPFPFEAIASPQFMIEKQMNLCELIGHLQSWSATQKFIQDKKTDPTEKLFNQLLLYWKNPDESKNISWKIILKVGKNMA